jgi:rare lipoprotein A (peptidoglycan hydrolase)
MKSFKQFISEIKDIQTGINTKPNNILIAKNVKASSYGPGLYGGRTASGERFTPSTRGVAHKTLPLGSQVDIKDPNTGRRVRATVNDRGPYIKGREYDIGPGTTVDLGYGKEGNPDWKKFGHRTLDIEPVKPTAAKPKPSSSKKPVVGLKD